MVTVPVLTDGVVTLREHGEDDLDRLVEQCSDAGMQEWTTVPSPYTPDDGKQFIRHAMPGGWESDQEWGFGVEHDGRFVATVLLRNIGRQRAEIAFGSHPDARGKGLLKRAVLLLLQWGFAPVAEGGRELESVLWMANRGNWGSRRLAWSVGFAMHDTWPRWLNHRGVMTDAWTATLRRGDALSPASPWLEAPRITGSGVVLRQLEERDLPRIVDVLNDDRTQHFLEMPREGAPHTVASTWDFVLVRQERAAAGTGVDWAYVDPETDQYLGQVSLFGLGHPRTAEVGFMAHPDARGRGLTTEAVRRVVRHCFVPTEDGGLGLRRVRAGADVANTASRGVLGRVGFTHVGTERSLNPMRDGTWSDDATYDLLASEVGPD